MRTALITGVKSFTGSYVKAELEAAGYCVNGTVHGASAVDANASSLDLCDRLAVCDLVAQIKPDIVVHLAAITFVAHGDAEEMYRTNIVGTRNVLQALSECPHQTRICLLASSANIYSQAMIDSIDETVTPNPMNDYAVSKLAMEYMARLWMDKLPITIVRPFNYTGVGQDPKFLIPKIVNHYRRGDKEIELGNLDIARDFSDVRFIAKAYAKLVEKAPTGETFNLCAGKAHSLQEILDMMESIAGYKIKASVNPAFVRENEIKLLRGSGEKLFQTIGLKSAFSLKDTLSWMYKAP